MTTPPSGISRRGFASLTPERRAEISRMGGAAGKGTKRGFAIMDPKKHSEISRTGGSATRKSLTSPKEPLL